MLLVIPLLIFSACDNNEQKTNKEEIQTEEKKSSVLDNIPDFPMPLQTLIESYNKSDREGFTPIESNASEIEFVEESVGYSKNLIDENTDSTDYSITAMFNGDKKFKRITYTQVIKDQSSEESIIALLALFDTLGIDTNYIEEFLVTENDYMDFTTEIYTVNFRNMSSTDILNVTIDGK